MSKKPKAERLADCLDRDLHTNLLDWRNMQEASAELRKLSASNIALKTVVDEFLLRRGEQIPAKLWQAARLASDQAVAS
jgi:hypothetical protein